MNRLFSISLLAFLVCGLVLVGCDSDDTSSPDRIVGTWMASSADLAVDSGTFLGTVEVPVAFASGEGEIVISFRDDATYTLRVMGPIRAEFFGEGVDLVGEDFNETTASTYSIQNNGQIRFGTEVDVDYAFDGDNEFSLSVENSEAGREVLALLLDGAVDPDVIDMLEGGSITFRRDS